MTTTGRRLPGLTCPTGKVRYRNETRALTVLSQIWSRAKPGRRLETRAYRCAVCGSWHLTSKAAP